MITPEELNTIVVRLREQGTDDASVEVKTCSNRLSSDVWETVSAFANTAGGTIICGLSEEQGFTPAAHFDADKVRDQFVTGIGDGGQPALVAPVPRYQITRGVVDGEPVLVIEISELHFQDKPCYIVARGVQAGSFKRVDDKDIRLSPSEIYELQSVLLPSDADGEIVEDATVEDLDSKLVDAVIENRRAQSPRVLRGLDTRERQLERLNITNKAGGVRLAGLLAVGQYPQQFYPKLDIDVAVHPGTEKSQPGAPRFLDRVICDGPLSACIEDALAAIGRNLRKASYVYGAGRVDEWEVPVEVLREALTNAVIHREYSPMFVGESVSVDIYPDRIEVRNPGGLWGGKTVDTLADGESRCRNAKLMSLMGAVPLQHGEGYIAESQGSGISAMIREMETRSLGRPTFIAKPDSFKVILARHGVEIEQNKAWLKTRVGRDLSRREETLLMLIREDGKAHTVSELRGELGWDSDEIRALCRELVEEGLLIDEGDESFICVDDQHEGEALPSELPLRERIMRVIGADEEVSARELAERLDVDISKVRYALPKLIEEGQLVPTAGVRSRLRKYRRGAAR